MTELTDRIISNAGITYEDLKLPDQDTYEEQVTLYVEAVQAWIDRYTKTAYTDEDTYPIDLELIVYNIVLRILSMQSIQQDLPIIDNDNFRILYQINKIITEDDKDMLKPFQKKLTINMFILGQETVEDDDDDIDDVE